jgi:dihydrofolate synthase/folylpolyglutamate synthase
MSRDLSYSEALKFLDERTNFERVRPSTGVVPYTLERMKALMSALGNPQDSLKCAHVAGSKGKGSTVEMIAASLGGCGHTVGVYMSPHVLDVRERIRIGNERISEEVFASLVCRVWRAAPAVIAEHGEPTFFEILTAMAFCYFAMEAVDLAVIEVGLGGRLDATNVLKPLVTVITAIQLEHTDILGDSLEKIATEKAGIMKPGVPCITVPQDPAAMGAIKSAAEALGVPLAVVGETLNFSYRLESSPDLGPHARILLLTPTSAFEHLAVPLKGEHQAWNCGAALAAVDVLRRAGIEAPEVKVAAGLARTPNHGRFEVIQHRPRIIIDGAHNPESIEGLVRAVGLHLRVDSTIIVFGCAADKDYVGMLRKLARGADKVIFTRAAGNARAADPRELARKFESVSGHMAQTAASVRDALDLARRAATRDDLILVTGSFYVAGEAKRVVLGTATDPKTAR